MKRILLMMAVIIAVILSSCSSDGYKSYIPADSKVVGKIDLKEFFTQTGVDRDKLMSDLKQELGKDAPDFANSGLDMTTPMYLFVSGDASDASIGFVAKVEDRAKTEVFLAKNLEMKVEKISDRTCFIESDNAFGVNDEALVVVSRTTRDKDKVKSELNKILDKNGEGSISDNKMFALADGSNSFLSLYADMSIIPSELFSMAEKQTGMSSNDLEDLRTMEIGVDGSASDGICDFKLFAKSNKEEVQTRINDALKAFGAVSEKATQSFSVDDAVGFAMNIDGEQIVNLLKKAVEKISNPDLSQMANDALEKLATVLNKIKGNVTASFKSPEDYIIKAEGKNCTAEVVGLMREFGLDQASPFSYGDGSGNQASGLISAGNGYCLNGNTWFGYAGGNFYVTGSETLAAEPTKLVGSTVPSSLISLMENRRQVLFLNVDKMSSYADMASSDSGKPSKAFSAITEKVKYVTISYK